MKDTLGRENRKLEDRKCEACGKEYRPRRAASRFCSRPCLWSKNGGQNRKEIASWWKDQKGYVSGRVWENGVRVRYRFHRWLMEQYLGRKLKHDEDVHHINGDKLDNRLENLQLMTHSEHSTKSNLTRTIAKAEGSKR